MSRNAGDFRELATFVTPEGRVRSQAGLPVGMTAKIFLTCK
jgi:hypothetical protein